MGGFLLLLKLCKSSFVGFWWGTKTGEISVVDASPTTSLIGEAHPKKQFAKKTVTLEQCTQRFSLWGVSLL